MQKQTKTFQDLIVWQKAHEFVLGVYKLTETFPAKENFGLTSQFRRAAVSIAANIAEGFKKFGKQDKIKFFNIAHGSLEECRYYLILSKDLSYGSDTNLNTLIQDTSKLLTSYIEKIKLSK
jgi:four helix bundle protein